MADIEGVSHNQTPAERPRAYSYLRFSTPEQMAGDSFRRQSTLAAAYATKHGLDLDTELTFQDLGVSAYRGANFQAGALGQFLEAVHAGEVPQGSYLLIESLDRMSRMDPWDALPVFQMIINAGVNVVTLIDEKVYSREEMRAQPMKIMESLFVMIRANEESATKSRRGKASWQGKRIKAADIPMTATCPAWLTLNEDKVFEVLPERGAVVQEIYKRYATGEGPQSIASSLNQRAEPAWGKPRSNNGEPMWYSSYVIKILENTAVTGRLIPHRVDYLEGRRKRIPLDPIDGYYPAVVSPSMWNTVSLLRKAAVESPQKTKGELKNILSGLAKCPKCGGTMSRVNKGNGKKKSHPYLVCVRAKQGAGCGYKAVRYNSVEGAIIRNASAIFEYAPIGDKGGELDAEIESLDNAIDAKEDAIRWMLNFIEGGGAVTPATRTELAKLEAEHEELEGRYNALIDQADLIASKVVDARFEELEDALTQEPINRQRINVALRTLVDNVVVEYGGGELIFNWRHGGETRIGYGWPEGAK